mgnify:FL=1
MDYPRLSSLQQEYAQNIKGIYINLWTLSHGEKRKKIIKEIKESSLNAIVIDLKDIKGRTPFIAKPLKSFPYNLTAQDLKDAISKWQKQGIYVIGRIAVFKDEALATYDKQSSLKYKKKQGDRLVQIRSKNWTNPYSKEVWCYNINIAKKMAELGFDELQFDYIRFPTLRENSTFTIQDQVNVSRAEAILGFLTKAKEELKQYNIILSVDLFGLTTTVNGDLGIGQEIKRIARQVDYISPMLYPSHYSEGSYGIDNPETSPYQIIVNSLADAKQKLGANSYKLRPWLQDFSLSHNYTKKEIRDQIKAVKDENLSSWLLWNPQSKYTIEAVMLDNKEGLKNGS